MDFLGSLLYLLLAVVSILLANAHWERIEDLARWVLQRALTAKLGVTVTVELVVLRRWSFELRNVLIANGPGDWDAPYALQCLRLCARFSLLGLLSVFVPNGRWGACEFLFGFRIKEVETIEVDGLSIFLEDAKKMPDEDTPSAPPLLRGILRKEPSNGFGLPEARLLVLRDGELCWFAANHGDEAAGKPRGTLRLSEHSSVSVHDDEASPRHRFQFVVVSGRDAVTLYAHGADERREWVSAVRGAIGRLGQVGAEGQAWRSNAAWIERIACEEDGKKTRRRLHAQRRRLEWQRRWSSQTVDGSLQAEEGKLEAAVQPGGDLGQPVGTLGGSLHSSPQKSEAALGLDVADARDGHPDESPCEGAATPTNESGAAMSSLGGVADRAPSVWDELARGASKWVEVQMSAVSEGRVHESIEWQIGRLSVRGMTVRVHKQPHLTLGAAGWHMRGFVGSELDLKARLLMAAPTVVPASGASASAQLQLGLAAQLLNQGLGCPYPYLPEPEL